MRVAVLNQTSRCGAPYTSTLERAVNVRHAEALIREPMSELDRIKEQLVYLRFWLGIMVVTEITLVGWLISTPIGTNPTLWFIGAFGAVLLAAAIFVVHRQVQRRIDQIGKL